MTSKAYWLNIWNAILARPQAASGLPLSEPQGHSSAFAVAGGCPAREYFVAIVLTKPNSGGSTAIALRTGRWNGTSENEALGAAVEDAMSANPGYHIGMTRVMTAQDNK